MAERETIDYHGMMDYHEHEKTYAFFVGFAKWSTIAIVVILVLMAIFLL